MSTPKRDDIAIPTLPSRSVRDTLAFYRRLGLEGEILGDGDSYAILRRALWSFTSSHTMSFVPLNQVRVAISGFRTRKAFIRLLLWHSCPGEASRAKMPSKTSRGG